MSCYQSRMFMGVLMLFSIFFAVRSAQVSEKVADDVMQALTTFNSQLIQVYQRALRTRAVQWKDDFINELEKLEKKLTEEVPSRYHLVLPYVDSIAPIFNDLELEEYSSNVTHDYERGFYNRDFEETMAVMTVKDFADMLKRLQDMLPKLRKASTEDVRRLDEEMFDSHGYPSNLIRRYQKKLNDLIHYLEDKEKLFLKYLNKR